MKFLLDNSVSLVGLSVLAGVSIVYSIQYMRRNQLSLIQYINYLKLASEDKIQDVSLRLAASVITSMAISIVSYRELWDNDTFRAVFFSSLILGRVYKGLKRITERL